MDLRTVRGALGQAVPPGWRWVEVRRTVAIGRPRSAVWAWLDDPATFVDGQVWPYRVEFVRTGTDLDVRGTPRPAFRPGVRNTHHGPGLSLPAVVGEVRPPEYRELIYLYGAYVGSPRLVRPARLLFDLAPDDGGTSLTVTTEAAVRATIVGAWRIGNERFWSRFGRWAERAVG